MRGPRLGQAKCLLQGHLSVLSYGLQGVSVFIRAPTIVLSAGLGTRRSYAALFLDLRLTSYNTQTGGTIYDAY